MNLRVNLNNYTKDTLHSSAESWKRDLEWQVLVFYIKTFYENQ